jgi:DNA-directed RNA polymerase subunit RPC12/RpoP
MSFIKNKEDFICENCGFKIIGNGYTNHCSRCLFSKHVDIEPGDRLNSCNGLMEPVYVSYTNKDKYVINKCLKCSLEKRNILNDEDSVDVMIKIQNKLADK